MNDISKGDFFPFTAIVGQEEMKLALILNIINPGIGGVLVFGEKGTAKSTAVRSIAGLLPKMPVVKGCRFRCAPQANEGIFENSRLCPECLEKYMRGEKPEIDYVNMKVVDLPVSATEDRVVGSLDIEKAITEGVCRFEAGILASANRGILYIDEINLLDDHLVDLLLDSAAMHVNIVERESVSFSHPAQFILVGSMNPEEGELRPQLLDRFGLCVEIKSEKEAASRVEIIKRRSEFDMHKKEFLEKYHEEEQRLCEKIVHARGLLNEVSISDKLLYKTALLAIKLDVDGHRGDLTLVKTAKANAAFNSRKEVTIDDIKAVVKMTFLHRLKSLPFQDARKLDIENIYKILETEE
jgi:Mg-chelatase subunit ChlI